MYFLDLKIPAKLNKSIYNVGGPLLKLETLPCGFAWLGSDFTVLSIV